MKTLLTTIILLCSVYSFGQCKQIKFKHNTFQVVNQEYELFWGDGVFSLYCDDDQYLRELTIAIEDARFYIQIDRRNATPYYIVEVVDGGLLWTFRGQTHWQAPNEKIEI
jgi:hypothetical protein